MVVISKKITHSQFLFPIICTVFTTEWSVNIEWWCYQTKAHKVNFYFQLYTQYSLQNKVFAFDDGHVKGNHTKSISVFNYIYSICTRMKCWLLMMIISKNITDGQNLFLILYTWFARKTNVGIEYWSCNTKLQIVKLYYQHWLCVAFF